MGGLRDESRVAQQRFVRHTLASPETRCIQADEGKQVGRDPTILVARTCQLIAGGEVMFLHAR